MPPLSLAVLAYTITQRS